MSQYKAGDKVWLHINNDIGTHKYPGVIYAEHPRSLMPAYLIECLIDGDEKLVKTDEENLGPRTNTIDSIDARYAEKPPDPIEAAVKSMATSPIDNTPSLTLQYINTAIGLLTQAVNDDHKLLGHDYPVKAIEAALPLLREVRSEID